MINQNSSKLKQNSVEVQMNYVFVLWF